MEADGLVGMSSPSASAPGGALVDGRAVSPRSDEVAVDVPPAGECEAIYALVCSSTCGYAEGGKGCGVDGKEGDRVQAKLTWAIVLCLFFMGVEVAGGILSHSLAVLTDAAHLLSDVAGFAISLSALWMAGWKPTRKHTFGFHRVEILGAFASILLIWMVTGVIVYEAFWRMLHTHEHINGRLMLATALVGVLVNIAIAVVLHDHHGHGHGHGHSHQHSQAHICTPKVPRRSHEASLGCPHSRSTSRSHHSLPIQRIAFESPAPVPYPHGAKCTEPPSHSPTQSCALLSTPQCGAPTSSDHRGHATCHRGEGDEGRMCPELHSSGAVVGRGCVEKQGLDCSDRQADASPGELSCPEELCPHDHNDVHHHDHNDVHHHDHNDVHHHDHNNVHHHDHNNVHHHDHNDVHHHDHNDVHHHDHGNALHGKQPDVGEEETGLAECCHPAGEGGFWSGRRDRYNRLTSSSIGDVVPPPVRPGPRGQERRAQRNINLRGALLHVVGDLIQSVGVAVAGAVIWVWPHLRVVDLLCSFVFSTLVLVTTIRILRDIFEVLMESTPRDVDVVELEEDLRRLEGVVDVHELHIWAISIGKILLACHLKVEADADADQVLFKATELCVLDHNIGHVTIQVERPQRMKHVVGCGREGRCRSRNLTQG